VEKKDSWRVFIRRSKAKGNFWRYTTLICQQKRFVSTKKTNLKKYSSHEAAIHVQTSHILGIGIPWNPLVIPLFIAYFFSNFKHSSILQ